MRALITLTEEDKMSLNRFYKNMRLWKRGVIILTTGICTMFLYGALVYEIYWMIWFFIFFIVFGWFSFRGSQKSIFKFEADIHENIKVRVTGRIIKFFFRESAGYITFNEDDVSENEEFLLTHRNDKIMSQAQTGAKVEVEYTPYCRYLLNIKPL